MPGDAAVLQQQAKLGACMLGNPANETSMGNASLPHVLTGPNHAEPQQQTKRA